MLGDDHVVDTRGAWDGTDVCQSVENPTVGGSFKSCETDTPEPEVVD